MIYLLLAQISVFINAGAVNSLGSQDSYAISPTANVEVYAETADVKYSPDLSVKLSLSSLPEEALRINDPSTFKTVEFQAGLEQPIPGINPKLCGAFGIASRLPGDKSPRVSAAKYFTFGMKFATEDYSSYLYIGAGPDQRLNLNGLYSGTFHVDGKVKLYNYKSAKLSLTGNAILGGKSSIVRVGIVVGV